MHKFHVTQISLYDAIIISEFINTPFNLYGAQCSPYSKWTPIGYGMVKNYDIVIERSVTQNDRFIIIKLKEEIREDLK